jgi:hypothetical protein
LALLITMQNAVPRNQLGIATSLNQFSRSIGQTVGVAAMGTVMTLSLSAHLTDLQRNSGLPESEIARWAHNLNALVDPGLRAEMPPELLSSMASVLGGALHNVFNLGTALSALALVAGLWLPRMRTALRADQKRALDRAAGSPGDCERVLMAEMTTIDAEDEPAAAEGAAD